MAKFVQCEDAGREGPPTPRDESASVWVNPRYIQRIVGSDDSTLTLTFANGDQLRVHGDADKVKKDF